MKRIAWLWLAGGLMAAMVVSAAAAQNNDNLGDVARQVRKQKAQGAPAAKAFDNDNLPRADKLSVVGQEPEQPAADADQAASNDASANNGETGAATNESASGEAGAKIEAGDPASKANAEAKDQNDEEQAAKQRMYKEWQQKIQGQKDKIDLATRELDVANREYRLRAAAFYADAGNRLRNSGAWDKEDAQYKEQIAAKQKALDDAKQSLDDMEEQARKSGVPSSMRE